MTTALLRYASVPTSLRAGQTPGPGSGGAARDFAGIQSGGRRSNPRLSIVQERTEVLGGTVEVESEKGPGARFTVRFPMEERD